MEKVKVTNIKGEEIEITEEQYEKVTKRKFNDVRNYYAKILTSPTALEMMVSLWDKYKDTLPPIEEAGPIFDIEDEYRKKMKK